MISLVNQLSLSSAMSEDEEAFGKAWCIRTNAIFPFALDAAIDLGVFDVLAKAGPGGKLSSKQIASEIHAKNPDAPFLLDRMLRLLVCYDLLTFVSQKLNVNADNEEDGERLYGLTLAGEAFANDENGGSLAGLSMNMVNFEVWSCFKDSVLEGGNSFEKMYGMSAYQHFNLNPEKAKRFDAAMAGCSKRMLKIILEKYQGFQGMRRLVDVGGGYGVTLKMIISKYPSIQAINYDLPHVVQQAPSFPGIEHIGGDMFSSVPQADAIMMKEVLHNWDDEHCLKLLRNCHEALEPKGKVIVISLIMVEEPEASYSAKFLCQMDLFACNLVQSKGLQNSSNPWPWRLGFQAFNLSALFSMGLLSWNSINDEFN